MTLEDFKRGAKDARKQMLELEKLYPACFHPNGKAVIAELRLYPPLIQRKPGKLTHASGT